MRPVVLFAVSSLALLASASGGTASGAGSERTILDLGDSLSVGTAPYLVGQLRGFRVERRHDVGLHAYDAAAVVVRERRTLPPVLVVSAGTNDDPRIVSTFVRAVSTIVRFAGARRCVVWPTIVRPPAVGATYDRLNRALVRAASRHANLVLVRWDEMILRHPGWLAGDGVHVDARGYRARAAAIASAVKTRCAR